jgi:hypothetical protein
MVTLVAEEEISKLLMMYEQQSITSFDFNETFLCGTEMFHYKSLRSFSSPHVF